MGFESLADAVLLDGRRIRATPEDIATQRAVADLLAEAWHCTICDFPALSAIDWYAARSDRFVGVLELKVRTHASGTYPTVYLSVRKWFALHLGSVGFGVPAIFVVKFTDRIGWVSLADIPVTQILIGGRYDRGARNDVEPLIEVPVRLLQAVRGGILDSPK